jgi:hypothetical protein
LFPAASPEAVAAPTDFRVSRDGLLAIIAVLAYAGIQVALFATHEAWRDEAQAWLWAKQLSTPWEFFFVPGEGHPPLWFWLLRALSTVLSFDQARLLTLGAATLNAWLLARLLRGNLLLLLAMLGSNILLQYWGYQFRPYTLVFTTVLCALLLDRRGHPIAAAWVLALSCGLHLFSGLLFGFWLLVLLQRHTPLTRLVGPALLAAAFGAMALISGLGNPAAVPKTGLSMLDRLFDILAWPAPPAAPAIPVAIMVLGTLAYALRRTPFLLIITGATTAAFALFGAIIYGASEWHLAYLLMLAFMALTLAGDKAVMWALPVLLVPQVINGGYLAIQHLTNPQPAETAVYEAVRADAGPALDPATSLFAFPDYALSASAARHDFTYISAMSGARMGPVQWRNRGTLDPALTDTPTPFWLVCMSCRVPLRAIAAAGLTATRLANGIDADGRAIAGYRIDTGI